MIGKKKKKTVESAEEIEEKKTVEVTPRKKWIDFLNMEDQAVEKFFDMLRDKKIVYDFDRWRCATLFKATGQDFDMTFGNLLCKRLFWQASLGGPQSEDLSGWGLRFYEYLRSDHIVFLFLKMWFSDGEYFKVSKQKLKEHLGDGVPWWDDFMDEAKEFVERYGTSVLNVVK